MRSRISYSCSFVPFVAPFLFATLAHAATPTTAPSTRPTVVIVVGAEGDPDFAPAFARSADRLVDAAKRSHADVTLIGRDPQPSPDAPPTDKDRLAKLLSAEAAKPSGELWLFLIGHGTYDGREAKFNLRGPDLSADEFANLLRPITRPIAVVNTTSSSAPFLNKLSGRNRVIVTATRSGHELQYARFGEHFASAITDPAADLDKDGQTSLLEAFLAASNAAQEFYKREGRLATEHALLDDNGDALGIPADFFRGTRATARPAKPGQPLDGPRAHQWHLVRSATEESLTADQRARRDALELQIESLRAAKATMPEADYYAKLESLLLDLARVYEK